MKDRLRKGIVGSIVILLVLALSTIALAGPEKITVTVENASIRRDPDMTSRVIEKPEVGQIFEVKKKTGTWYEIEFPSQVGIPVTGYIHEMFVEVTREGPEPGRKDSQISLRVGGLAHFTQAGYEYDFSFVWYSELATIIDEVENKTALGFDLGLGVFVSERVEIAGDMAYSSTSLTGLHGLSLPNEVIYNDIAYDDISTEPSLREIVISLGVNYHPMPDGAVRPYFGGGLSYVSGSIDIVEDSKFTHTTYQDTTHSIEFTEVMFKEESIGKIGLNLRAGADFQLGGNFVGFAEGGYILVSGESVSHPITSIINASESLDIKLGGLRLIAGVKVLF